MKSVTPASAPLKVLVVGGGSIGARHLRNLAASGDVVRALVEPDSGRREALCAETGVEGFAQLEAGLDWSPRLVVVATPSHLHLTQALASARRGCDLFIEKPLAHTNEGLDELAAEVEARALVTLVGCNMRFHPGPARVHTLIREGRIGRALTARLYAGSYLPGWRPGQDYTRSYSARPETGGGCLLDFVHEIDLARWYMGPVREVFCLADHVSALAISSEDVAALICRHASGSISEIHLDYVQRAYDRGCAVAGEEGSISWDFGSGVVKCFEAGSGTWTTESEPQNWELNRMYTDELSHLLDCVRRRVPTAQSVPEAIEVMRIVLAARESSRLGRLVAVAA
jgi:predicted dehydrogenase